jgi:hypothetical protein
LPEVIVKAGIAQDESRATGISRPPVISGRLVAYLDGTSRFDAERQKSNPKPAMTLPSIASMTNSA